MRRIEDDESVSSNETRHERTSSCNPQPQQLLQFHGGRTERSWFGKGTYDRACAFALLHAVVLVNARPVVTIKGDERAVAGADASATNNYLAQTKEKKKGNEKGNAVQLNVWATERTSQYT